MQPLPQFDLSLDPYSDAYVVAQWRIFSDLGGPPSLTSAEPIRGIEQLHHAIRPWVVIDQAAQALRPGEQLVLTGESLDRTAWPHWGVRLDPTAINRMRASGVFEAEWSLPFVMDMMARAGLAATAVRDPLIGLSVVGTKHAGTVPGPLVAQKFRCSGVVADGTFAGLVGAGGLAIPFPSGAAVAVLHLMNHRPRGLRVAFQCDGHILLADDVPTGPTLLRVPRLREAAVLSFVIESWQPNVEVGNGDMRTIGIHLRQISFESA